MTGADAERASSTCAQLFQFIIPAYDTSQTTWTFDRPYMPNMRLAFPQRPPSSTPKKRSRPTADVDGEHSCMQKKKRRLRLFLITSRLSPQFSHPATNIVDRGSSKIAVWAKQKALGRNLLRKAAILNRIGRRAALARGAKEGHGRVLVEQEREGTELRLARLEFDQTSVDTYTRPVLSQTQVVSAVAATRKEGSSTGSASLSTSPPLSRSPSPTLSSPPQTGEAALEYRSPNEAYAHPPHRAQGPRRDYLPLPPSPLGLSNYDAFDIDDDIPDPYSHMDEEDESTFNPYGVKDIDDSPFSPPTVKASSSAVEKDASHNLKTPLQTLYSDFSVLDPEQAVFGDYDQVDDGADAIWPEHEPEPSMIGSTSPDFYALFATAPSQAKRTDSFTTLPEFHLQNLKASVSPNFPPTPVAFMASSNFTFSASMNFSSPPPIRSATGSQNPQPVFKSPNFAAVDAPPMKSERLDSIDAKHIHDPQSIVLGIRNSDIEQEQQRQRNLMFMRFGL